MPVTPSEFVNVLRKHDLGPFIGVPCSYLSSLINYVLDHPEAMEYLNPTNEAHAMALAAGYYMGTGRIPVVFMQNSGLGNVMNPLTSLNQVYKLPALMLVTWRGEGAWGSDAPEHDIPGRDLETYLKALHLPYRVLVPETCAEQVRDLKQAAEKESIPVVGVVKQDFFRAYEGAPEAGLPRYEAIRLIKESLPGFRFLSTTGFISRESFAIKPSPDFYMVGSMGLIAGIGCGVALARPDVKVAVLDGDGAILMHLGLVAYIGNRKPANFYHFVLDNGVYGSTQNQPTVSGTVQLDKLALCSGYRAALHAATADELQKILGKLSGEHGPVMIWVKVAPGNKKGIGRVSVPPEQMKTDFMKGLRG
jgi:phosphonopyruvate decarboxylase